MAHARISRSESFYFQIGNSLVVMLVIAATVAMYLQGAHRKAVAEANLSEVGARTCAIGNGEIYAIAVNGKSLFASSFFDDLSVLNGVERLSLSRSQFDGHDLKKLSELKNLRSVACIDSNLTNLGLGYLGSCRSIEALSLDGTTVTSAGVSAISELEALEYLSLARTDVDDSCVDVLAQLPSLVEVDLRRTNVTEFGARRLRELQPACRINFDRI